MGQVESIVVIAESGTYVYEGNPVITMEGGALALDYKKDGKYVSVLFGPGEWKRAEISYKDAA